MSQAHMGTCQSCQQTHSTGHKLIFITAVNRLRHRESSEDYFYKRLYWLKAVETNILAMMYGVSRNTNDAFYSL